MSVEEQAKRDQDRENWRLAAILFVGGGLGAVPTDALHQPPHPPTVYLLPLLALVSGAVCWLLSERADGRWLHAMAFIATLEVALTVELADPVFAISLGRDRDGDPLERLHGWRRAVRIPRRRRGPRRPLGGQLRDRVRNALAGGGKTRRPTELPLDPGRRPTGRFELIGGAQFELRER
jgi:hypothetical protein